MRQGFIASGLGTARMPSRGNMHASMLPRLAKIPCHTHRLSDAGTGYLLLCVMTIRGGIYIAHPVDIWC